MDVQQSCLDLDVIVDRIVTQTLIDSDIPLPDGRDAAEVLSACANQSGMDAVVNDAEILVSGKLEMELLCRQLSGETFGFTASSAFSHAIDQPEAENGMTAVVTAQIVECNCTAEAGRLRLSAILELHVLLIAPVDTPFVTGILSCAHCECRETTVAVMRRCMLSSHSLRIREEITANAAESVLLGRGAAEIKKIAFAGNAASVDGVLHITALTASEDGTLQRLTESIPFSDVFDAPYCESVWGTATVDSLHVVAADPGFGVIDVEAVVTIRLFGVKNMTHTAISDAYATDGAFTTEQKEVSRLLCLGGMQRTVAVNENIAIPKHLPDAYSGIYATVTPAVTNTYEEDGKFGVDAMLLVTAMYRCDAGKYHAFTEDLPIQFCFDMPFSDISAVTLECLRCEMTGSGRTLSLSALLNACAERYALERVHLTSDIVSSNAQPVQRGIVIYCAGAGETLWDVGKRFSVPIEQLRTWNADLCDPLPEGKQIVLMA